MHETVYARPGWWIVDLVESEVEDSIHTPTYTRIHKVREMPPANHIKSFGNRKLETHPIQDLVATCLMFVIPACLYVPSGTSLQAFLQDDGGCQVRFTDI